MKLLVLAYPRSGTRYTHTILNSFGLKVGHERVEKDGVVSWKHIYEPADLILHQVRYPLNAINSCVLRKGSSRRYMSEITGLPRAEGFEARLLFLAKVYLSWHDLIENRNPIIRYRVEDLPWKRTSFTDHGKTIEYPFTKLTFKRLEMMDKDVAIRLKKLTKYYGYEVRNEDT